MPTFPLTDAERARYIGWLLDNNVPTSNDYNMEGFYKASQLNPHYVAEKNPNDGMVHFPDAFKYPNHHSFSTDSNYFNPATMPNTPTWSGGELPNGGASWALRKPDGTPVVQEAPWLVGGIK